MGRSISVKIQCKCNGGRPFQMPCRHGAAACPERVRKREATQAREPMVVVVQDHEIGVV